MPMLTGYLRRQAATCYELKSALTACLLLRIANDCDAQGPCRDLFGHRESAALPNSMLGPRIAGAMHSLVLAGLAPELATFYPTAGGSFVEAGFWEQALAVLMSNMDFVNAYIENPPQTNEVGRAGTLLAGFLLVARETGLPLRCLEAGASAGLLLHWDRYRYDLDGAHWGDSSSPVLIRNRWRGTPAGLPARVSVSERRGCDLNPVDLGDPEETRRLSSYIWGDHPGRLARLDAAMAVAARDPAPVDRQDAASWIEAQLADPRPGVATVFYTCFASMYFGRASVAAIRDAFSRAAAIATPEAPLALLQLERTSKGGTPRLQLSQWPGNTHRILAGTDLLGRSTTWAKARR